MTLDDTLNIASFIPQTLALGPGLRAALWLQGCALRCPGCIVPEWQAKIPNQILPVDQIVEWIVATPSITGLTLSGGEPFLQAVPLAQLIHKVKKERDLNIISFSGYTLEYLVQRIPQVAQIGQILDQIDVLIDGPYIQALDYDKGLRGSSNQRVHYLSSRLSSFDLDQAPRQAEFHIQNDAVVLAGVPPAGILNLFQGLSRQINPLQEVNNER